MIEHKVLWKLKEGSEDKSKAENAWMVEYDLESISSKTKNNPKYR